jgi:hypothetical protein
MRQAMYACILETGRGFFRGGVRIGESATHFSRPTPTSPFANSFVSAPCPGILAAANLYSLFRYLVLAMSRKAGQLPILCPDRVWFRGEQKVNLASFCFPLP